MKGKIQIRGCRSIDLNGLEDHERCPFQAYFLSGVLCCSRWGSGTPLIGFLKECTVADLKECPLTDYPNEPLLVFWTYWLWKKGKISKEEENLGVCNLCVG